MSKGFEIPWNVADDITLASLKSQYQLNKNSFDKYYNGEAWLHPDDIEECSLMLHHLKAVIKYYGGSIG